LPPKKNLSGMTKFHCALLAASLAFLAAPALAQSDTAKKELSYAPKIDGLLKLKFEQSLSGGRSRFDVRSSRLGISGSVAEAMSYRSQVELSNEGTFAVLDAYIAYRPLPLLSLQLGQQHLTINSDVGRSPMQNIFSNRSLLAKFGTSYTDNSGAVSSTGSRDIGGVLILDLSRWMPMRVRLGAFNGSGANRPQWRDALLYTAKLEYGRTSGLWAAVSGMAGANAYAQHITLMGYELKYVAKNFTVHGEAMMRSGGGPTTTSSFAQGFYKFDLKPNRFAHYLAPALRWDMLSKGVHSSFGGLPFNAQRLTVGLNVGVAQAMFSGEIRLNYESYLLATKYATYAFGELLHDKLTLEMVVVF
jgi:hypothetical protein